MEEIPGQSCACNIPVNNTLTPPCITAVASWKGLVSAPVDVLLLPSLPHAAPFLLPRSINCVDTPNTHRRLLDLPSIQSLHLKMPSQSDDKRQAAREVVDILHEISTLLVCDPSAILGHGIAF